MSEKKKYRTFTPEQKTEIVLAGLRGDRTVRDICRKYSIAETLYYQWRDRLLEGGKAALATPRGTGAAIPAMLRTVSCARRSLTWSAPSDARLRTGGRGGTFAGLDVSVRVSRARAVVATGRRPAVVARVAGITARRSTVPSRPVLAQRGPGRAARATTRSSRSPRPTRPTEPGWSQRSHPVSSTSQ
jgi:transposase